MPSTAIAKPRYQFDEVAQFSHDDPDRRRRAERILEMAYPPYPPSVKTFLGRVLRSLPAEAPYESRVEVLRKCGYRV